MSGHKPGHLSRIECLRRVHDDCKPHIWFGSLKAGMRINDMQSILQEYDPFSGIESRAGNLQYLWIVPIYGIAASLARRVAVLVPLSTKMSGIRVAKSLIAWILSYFLSN